MNTSPTKHRLLGLSLALLGATATACGGGDEEVREGDAREQVGADDGDDRDDESPRGDGGSKSDASTQDSGAGGGTKDAGTDEPDEPDQPPAEAFKPAPDAKVLALRADTFVLSSPGVVLRPFGRETSVTTNVQQGINDSLKSDADPDNNMNGVADSGDGDGFVDMNLIFRFEAAGSVSESPGSIEVGGARCAYPFDASKACEEDSTVPFQTIAELYDNGSDCTLAGTSEVASGACFMSEPGEMVLELPLLGPVPLQEAQVIGSWVDGGAGGVTGGQIRGFLSEEIARATTLGDDLPPLAVTLGIKPGLALAEFFPTGGKQMNDAGVPGWWFAIRFSAKPIALE